MTKSINDVISDNEDMTGKSIWAFAFPNYEPTRGELDKDNNFHPYRYGSRQLSDKKLKSQDMYISDSYDEAVQKYDECVAAAEKAEHEKVRKSFESRYICGRPDDKEAAE